MSLIVLMPWDLGIAAILVILMAFLSWYLRLGVHGQIVVAASRTVVQLLLIGLVLKALFAHVHLLWMSLLALVMLLAAGREVMMRQKHRLRGAWGYGVGTGAMFLSSFVITIFALTVVINNQPWYSPQYAIPLLGMMLGNTMTGIAVGLDRLTQATKDQYRVIEQRLMLGHSWCDAIAEIRRQSIRGGMIPIINAMAAAGIVSLPGMMTGQILAGAAPVEAVKYQILIMFLISAGTGFGTMMAVWFASKRLFDERHRLRMERLT